MKKIYNFIKSPKIKMIGILSILLFIYTTICAISYAQNVSSEISESVFRLHVIANSDTNEDQALKYKVRDNLISYMNTLIPNCKNKQDAINIVNSHLDEFKKIAKDTIQNEGFNYDVNLNIGNFEFPTKHYGDISLPAGYYDALRVEIGEAKGQNWWCVMFPPLCFVDISTGIVPEESKNDLKENLSDEEFALISNDKSSDIKFKFKILELFTPNELLTARK